MTCICIVFLFDELCHNFIPILNILFSIRLNVLVICQVEIVWFLLGTAMFIMLSRLSISSLNRISSGVNSLLSLGNNNIV